MSRPPNPKVSIKGRDATRLLEEVSAKRDSPNGGLRAIRERNEQLLEQRQTPSDPQRGQGS